MNLTPELIDNFSNLSEEQQKEVIHLADYRSKTIDIFYLVNGKYQKVNSLISEINTEVQLLKKDTEQSLYPFTYFIDMFDNSSNL